MDFQSFSADSDESELEDFEDVAQDIHDKIRRLRLKILFTEFKKLMLKHIQDEKKWVYSIRLSFMFRMMMDGIRRLESKLNKKGTSLHMHNE